MARNFVALMNELRNSSTLKEKNKLSNEVSDFLGTYNKYSSSFIVSVMKFIVISNVEPKFSEYSKSEFYEYRIKAYIDDDDKIKFFLAVSFLQSYEEYDEELDQRVMDALQKILKERNFDKIVNHVSVNRLQYKDNEILNIDF